MAAVALLHLNRGEALLLIGQVALLLHQKWGDPLLPQKWGEALLVDILVLILVLILALDIPEHLVEYLEVLV